MALPIPTFLRAQASAILATAVDFSTLFFCTEILGVYYGLSTALGAFAGAVTNFLVNRSWAFQAQSESVGKQAFKYALVSLGSLALNTGGVIAFTETFGFHYGFSKVVVALLVGIFFNYPLHKFLVFKAGKAANELTAHLSRERSKS